MSRVGTGFPGSVNCCAAFIGDVAAHQMGFALMNATFPLLEVDRVAGKVSMDQAMTPEAKVETLLTHGRAGEHEVPKRVPREMTYPPELRPMRDRCGLEAAGWPVQDLDKLDLSARRAISVRPVSPFGSGNPNWANVPGRVREGVALCVTLLPMLGDATCIFCRSADGESKRCRSPRTNRGPG